MVDSEGVSSPGGGNVDVHGFERSGLGFLAEVAEIIYEEYGG